MAAQPVLVSVKNVSKKYTLEHSRSRSDALRDILSEMFGGGRKSHTDDHHDIWALRNVSLKLRRGEGLGIIGHNGAGKSTLLKLLTGRFRPTEGTIETKARMGAITQLGIGFNPELTGRQNILVGATMLGFSHQRALEKMDEIIEFSGVGEFIEQPIKTYSSGMKARLGYAISAMMKPDVLLIDEVLAVGDMSFKRKCTRHINEFRANGGSILFVSHDLHAVQFVCDRVIVLERGRIVYEGNVFEGIKAYTQSMGQFEEDVVGASVNGKSSTLASTPNTSVEPKAEPEPTPKAVEEQATPEVISLPVQEEANVYSLKETPSSPAEEEQVVASESKFEVLRPPVELSQEHPIALTGLSIAPIGSDVLTTGVSARITVRYQSLIDLYPISWAYSLCSADGSINIATVIVGHLGTQMTVPAGEGEMCAMIPDFPLLAGHYQLRAGLADARDGVPFDEIGWHDAPVMFQVKSEDNILSSMHSVIGDFVAIKTKFEQPTLVGKVKA